MNRWSARTDIAVGRMVRWLGVGSSKFYAWRRRYGKVNEHNARVPRDHWLQSWETRSILDFEREYTLEGYRRLAFMMLDRDIVAVSPTSVYRVLKKAGRIRGWNRKPSRKGTGFHQPLGPHQHWHVDISYINVCGTFYYLCSVLDGYSRYIVHWEIRETMKEAEIELIIQRAREKFPDVYPRIISEQRTAVRREGFQDIHPDLRYDACPNVTVLSPEQREVGTLAQVAENRVHSTRHTVEPR